MELIERFLSYVSVDTQSDENSQCVPSTEKQKNLARLLKDELESMGLEDIVLDDLGYLYATLPANCNKSLPVIGFIAHMDTSPSMSGKDVKPRIVENYDGGDVYLPGTNSHLKVKDFPFIHIFVIRRQYPSPNIFHNSRRNT